MIARMRIFTRASEIENSKLGLVHCYSLAAQSDAPIVFMVHGRAGALEIMAVFRRCIPDEFSIVHVQAPHPDQIGGFSWWDVAEGRHGEKAIKAAPMLVDFVFAFIQGHQLKPKCKIGIGFSQGSGLLSSIGISEPGIFKGIAILAGFAPKGLKPTGTGKLPRFFWAHGSADETIPVAQAREGEAFLKAAGAEIKFIEDAVGHKIGTSGMRELGLWTRGFM